MPEAVDLANVGISNYVRDKGWGMSSLVGAIPSLIGGQQVTLTHIGKVFRITPENLERFREWWKYNRFEQYYIWVIGCFFGLALPAMLTIEFVPAGQEIDQWSAAAFQAEGTCCKRWTDFLVSYAAVWILGAFLNPVGRCGRSPTSLYGHHLDRICKCAENGRAQCEMDLLPNPCHLYSLGHNCALSSKAIFYDSGFCDNRRVLARDHRAAHPLRQSKVSTERDSTLDLAADWTHRVCRILLNLRNFDNYSERNS